MTQALCFKCGNTKFGAFTRCRECGSPPSGLPKLDIAFSDHTLSIATLEVLGRVKKRLKMTPTTEKKYYGPSYGICRKNALTF